MYISVRNWTTVQLWYLQTSSLLSSKCLRPVGQGFRDRFTKKKITLHLVPLSILIYFAVPRRRFSSAALVETSLIPVQMVVSKNWQSDQILSGMMCSCLHK